MPTRPAAATTVLVDVARAACNVNAESFMDDHLLGLCGGLLDGLLGGRMQQAG
jgi:hypothetical protein